MINGGKAPRERQSMAAVFVSYVTDTQHFIHRRRTNDELHDIRGRVPVEAQPVAARAV